MSDIPEPPDERSSLDDVDELIERYLVGNLTEAAAERLLERVETDPNMGQSILEQFTIDTMLRSLCGARTAMRAPISSLVRDGGGSDRDMTRVGRFNRSTVAVSAACIALIA